MLDLHFLLPARNSPGSTICNVNKLNSNDNTTIDGDAGQYDQSEDPVRAHASAIVKAQCSRSMINVSRTKIVSIDNDRPSTPSCSCVVVIVYLLTKNAIVKHQQSSHWHPEISRLWRKELIYDKTIR
jgi:hypothetical protein